MPLLLGMNADPEEVRQLQRRSELAQQRYEALMKGTPDLETSAGMRQWQTGHPDIPRRDFNTAIARLLDRPADALAYLGTYLERPDLSPLAIAIAMMYQAFFGDATAALEGCRKMGEDCLRGTDIWMPIFAELRTLPGTRELMRHRGLVDYWREFGAGDFCKPVEPDWSEFECR